MATALVVGNMIGSGIFLLPASLAPFGGVSVLGWGITAAGAVLLALNFAWLARLRAAPGGIYAYTRMAFGDFAGFFVAWSYWIAVWIANGAIAVALVSYLSVFVPVLGTSPAAGAAATVAFVWGLTAVNLHGVRSAGWMQLVTTVIKLIPLLAVLAWGIWWIEPAHFVPLNPTPQPLFGAVGAAAALTLWAMLGLESASIAAAQVHDPQRNVARATVIGTALAALVTAGACTVVMGLVPAEELTHSNAPFADAARKLWGETGAWIMGAAGVVSCLGALNGWILLSGQLPQAMADDGLFPAAVGRETRRGTPGVALVLGATLTTVVVLLNYHQSLVGVFTFLALLSTLATLIPYLFCTMAALWLLRTDATVPMTPLRGSVLIAASLYALWAIAGAGQETVYWGFLLMLTGLPVFVLLRRGRSKARA